MQNNAMASEKQIELLKRLGYQGSVEGLSMAQASNLITELRNGGQPQPQQSAQPQATNSNIDDYFNRGQAQPQSFQQPRESYQQPQYQQPYQPQVQQQSNLPSFKQELDALTNVITDEIQSMISQAILKMPENYQIGNALKSAYSAIMTSDQASKFANCSKESIAQSLTDYVVQGLDASKKQAYFIPYGNKMQMMRSYFGDVAVAKRTGLIKDVYAIVIHKGDEIVTDYDEYGKEIVVSHKTSFENKDNEIIGAYAIVVGINNYKEYTIMTKKQIDAAWKMSKNRGGSIFNDYAEEMAKRTCIRRAVKMIFNTSIEPNAIVESYNRTTEDEYDNTSEELREDNINDVHQSQMRNNATIDVDPSQYAPNWSK